MASSLPHEDDDAGGIVAEINITPLTDVFLVLLIIFMVTSSVIANTGKQVNLPEASVSTATDKQAVTVTITEAGEVQVNGKSVPYDQLGAHLKVALDAAEQKTVILRGDRTVILEKAVYVLDQAQLNGAKGFALATRKAK
ncbi:MAG: biopolymer transporter ExbD [Deltaproteobacteria bacterium]|nr:biopolymer transporter ExbD [Deltaproteobacteria bacterium]